MRARFWNSQVPATGSSDSERTQSGSFGRGILEKMPAQIAATDLHGGDRNGSADVLSRAAVRGASWAKGLRSPTSTISGRSIDTPAGPSFSEIVVEGSKVPFPIS